MPKEYFKTNVLLKNIVGKDLINDDNIAVLELVKNAYDAGARKVDLYFRNLPSSRSRKSQPEPQTQSVENPEDVDPAEPEILIVDDGSGMTRTDILQKWLNIAYSAKKYEPKKGRRVLAGNKGVGRFSCDRLGKKLDLYSCSSAGASIHLSVDWKKFEIENRPRLIIQKVPVILESFDLENVALMTGLSNWTKGTILHITGLRSVWGRASILKLKSYLERLFNPNQAFEKERFTLEIIAPDLLVYDSDAPEHERINGEVKNEIFERLNFKTTNIQSIIDDKGEKTTTILSHNGKEVYRIVEKNDFQHLRRVRVVIYFLNPYKKTYFRQQTGLDPVQFGSIFLFINGFRVPPYGDWGNDWLGLDVRKTQGTRRYIGTRDVVGRIEIDDLEDRFQVVSSREGIVKNRASDQLLPFYKKAHQRLETFVVQGLDWDSVPEHVRRQLRAKNDSASWNENTEEYKETASQKAFRIGENLLSVLNAEPDKVVSLKLDTEILDQVSSQHRETVNRILSHFDQYDVGVVDSKLKSALKTLREIVERQDRQLENLKKHVAQRESEIEKLTTEVSNQEGEILFLKSVSTLDEESLVNLLHQVALDSSTIKNFTERLLNRIAKKEPVDLEYLADALDRISFANKKVLTIAQFATKANFKLQAKPIKADLVTFVSEYLQNVAKDFVGAGLRIIVDNQNAEPFEISLKPIEVSIIFDNLLSNAKKAGAKEVLVILKRMSSERLKIIMRDNGKGLSPSITSVDSIFRRGFTTTTGSGLGLYHVSEILKKMNGTISVAPGDIKGTEFTIEVMK